MSPPGPVVGSQATQGEVAATPTTAPQPTPPEPPLQKVAELILKLDGLLLLNGAEAYREPWNELKAEVGKLHVHAQIAIDKALVQKLTEAVTDLVKKQNQPANAPTPRTYAAALQTGLPPWTGPPPVREVPTRLSRELVVRNPEATPEDRNRSITRIVEDINKTKSAEIKGKVLAARRLPSGDITITADTKETKELLERDSNWLAAIGQAAQVNRRKFTVMVHGMKIASVDCSRQEDAIRQITRQNTHLRDKIEILSLQWPKKALRRGKTSTCLIVDVATPEQANTLIDEGLLFHSELKECELYHGDCRVTQCYNCQKYGHTARICRAQKKCGLCAAPGHDDKDCNFRNDMTKHRCANCNLGHPAWSNSCAERRKQADKARLAYAARPRRYVSSTCSSPSQPQSSSSNPASSQLDYSPMSSGSVISVPSTQSLESQTRMEGIIQGPAREVGSTLGKHGRSASANAIQARRGPGRPPNRPQASPAELTDVTQVRRGPGRPPKRPQASPEEPTDPTQIRRGPGRPPNRPQASPDDQNIAAFFTQDEEL